MKAFLILVLFAAAPLAASAAQTSSKALASASGHSVRPAAARTIELTGGDTMKYDVASIHAHPGERLHIVLRSVGTAPKMVMAHNFVLLKPGVKPEDFVNAATDARATDFIPPAMQDKVIAAKGLVGPGETVEVTFTAPMKPGTYTYLCSFPGHYMVGMKGELLVK
jgi:azurin